MNLLEFMTKYEPIWLFLILAIETFVAYLSLVWLKKEYFYDETKDLEKKQRRTRTSKKTTTQPGGASIVEENTEIVEPTHEEKK